MFEVIPFRRCRGKLTSLTVGLFFFPVTSNHSINLAMLMFKPCFLEVTLF